MFSSQVRRVSYKTVLVKILFYLRKDERESSVIKGLVFSSN